MAGSNVRVDADHEFRCQHEFVVNVECRRVWLLAFRLRAFRILAWLAGSLTGLRVADVVVELRE